MRIFSSSQSGISLIEAIVFILIISIGLSAIVSVYLYTTRNSANTMLSLKTAELSQALMDEILSKGYDEETPTGGGCVGILGADTACNSSTAFSTFGIDGVESRPNFNDVDDYHDIAYCGAGVTTPDANCTSCTSMLDGKGGDISADYSGYSVCIRVSFAGNEMNNVALGASTTNASLNVATKDAKRIDIILRDPLDAVLTFTAYKANF